MKPLRILYIGTISGTCLDRAKAYRRLGHQVTHLDMRKWLPDSIWMDRITWRVGGHVFSRWMSRRMAEQIQGQAYDLCHVDNGEWVTPDVIAILKQHCRYVINYNIDDPTGPRDRARFSAYRRAVPHYDLLCVVRQENVDECKRLGAKRVMRVWRSADEVAHAPRVLSDEQMQRWRCEVLFLGTWMPERGPFLLELLKHGVPLTIQGGQWHKAPEWDVLKPHWRGGPISGESYAHAIQAAQINLGLLSKGNRDLHTTRSMEIPSLGGLLCAERTPEHQQLYAEGHEAIFWANAKECAQQCFQLLQAPDRAQSIAQQGRDRYLKSGYGNEAVLNSILTEVQP